MTGKELARAASDAVNSYSFNETEFCTQMEREHRTLQQSFTRLCFKWIEYCGKMEHYDGRNELSVKACKRLSEVIDEEAMALPMI